jgi:uncharacterized protein YhbP (UPF0306 family)
MKLNEVAKKKLLEYLESEALMSLATSDKSSNLWSASVYFANDEDLNFFFMSSSSTNHCKNIKINPNVSFTIADSRQWPQDEKFGIQVAGVCKHIYNVSEIIKIFKIWNKKFVKKPAPTLKSIKLDSPFYRITPTKLKVFDSKAKEKEKLYTF